MILQEVLEIFVGVAVVSERVLLVPEEFLVTQEVIWYSSEIKLPLSRIYKWFVAWTGSIDKTLSVIEVV